MLLVGCEYDLKEKVYIMLCIYFLCLIFLLQQVNSTGDYIASGYEQILSIDSTFELFYTLDDYTTPTLANIQLNVYGISSKNNKYVACGFNSNNQMIGTTSVIGYYDGSTANIEQYGLNGKSSGSVNKETTGIISSNEVLTFNADQSRIELQFDIAYSDIDNSYSQ